MRFAARNNEGFVLFSVIWIAGLLAVVASTFAVAVRLHVKSEANLAGSVEAEMAADGLVRLLAFRLAETRFSDVGQSALPIDGERFHCAVDKDHRAIVVIQDQSGLVDLNRAPLAVLAALIEKTAKQTGRGEILAQALADFRDSDSTRLGTAAPEENPIKDGPGMKNAPFQSVDEIEQVIPAGALDLARLKSVLTVYSRQEGIDPSSTPERLASMLDFEAGEGDAGRSAIAFVASPHKIFTIHVMVAAKNGSKFHRTATVALLREPLRPFAVLEWRQGSALPDDKAIPKPDDPVCDSLAF